MVTAFRLIQIIVVILLLPIAAIGGMTMFSGGNSAGAQQALGSSLLVNSFFVTIPAIIASEIVYRLMKHTRLPDIFIIPVMIAAIPLVMWAWYIFQLWSVG